jgi:HK97 family phage prohead protease
MEHQWKETKNFDFTEVKFDATGRTLEGHAAVFGNVDLVGDRIIGGAFRKTLSERGSKVGLLWQHDIHEPIGRPVELREDERGLFIKAVISDTRRGQDALALLRDNAIKGLSIGYDSLPGGTEFVTENGKSIRLLKEVRLWEISLVTMPANEEAGVTALKDVVPTEGKPWNVFHEGDNWVVRKVDADGKPTGKPLGTHPTEEEARAQVRALYANEPGKEANVPADEFKAWDTATQNNLPDSSFLHIESGGEKDSGGKTTPRSLRHLPYKNAAGKIDLPHLRNAISRLSQSNTGTEGGEKWLTDSLRKSLLAKARKMLASAGGKELELDDLKEIVVLFAGLLPNDEAPSTTDTSEAGPVSPPTEIDAAAMLKLIELEEAEINLMEV